MTLNPLAARCDGGNRPSTHGRGADAVIEAAGGQDTFSMAWQIARPNAVVALVAMYEKPQLLPLPDMYGKNLIFKTGGVDACHCGELLEHIAAGRLRTDFLITHWGPLEQILQGYQTFGERRETPEMGDHPDLNVESISTLAAGVPMFLFRFQPVLFLFIYAIYDENK